MWLRSIAKAADYGQLAKGRSFYDNRDKDSLVSVIVR